MLDESARRPAGDPGRAWRPTADPTQHGPTGGADTPRNPLDGEEAIPRAEFNKVVAQRQAAKEKVRQLTAEVEQLLSRLQTLPDGTELRAFQDWKELHESEGISPGQQARDIQAIASSVRRPLQAQVEELRGKRDVLERRLADLLRDQELRVAAARANAVNPEQVLSLLRDRVRMSRRADGQFVPECVDADGQPLPDGSEEVAGTQQLVDLFLSLPENANLVRSTVTPGSGARQAGGLANHMDFVPRSKAEFLSLPPEERLAVANRMTRQQRDVVIGRKAAGGGGYL